MTAQRSGSGTLRIQERIGHMWQWIIVVVSFVSTLVQACVAHYKKASDGGGNDIEVGTLEKAERKAAQEKMDI